MIISENHFGKENCVAYCDDDEKIASKIMEAFNNELHAHNLEATIDYYSSGNVLIVAVKEKHYNLALLDIDMTPLNGFDTAQSICSISSDTRIVFGNGKYDYSSDF